jgi:hypothetical protein
LGPSAPANGRRSPPGSKRIRQSSHPGNVVLYSRFSRSRQEDGGTRYDGDGVLPNDGITSVCPRDHSKALWGRRNLPRFEKSPLVCDELSSVSGSTDRLRPSGVRARAAGMRPKGASPSGRRGPRKGSRRHEWSLTGHRSLYIIGSRAFQGWRRGAGRFSDGVSHGQTWTEGRRKASIAWGILLRAEGVDSDPGQSRRKAKTQPTETESAPPVRRDADDGSAWRARVAWTRGPTFER